jgi:hypothetical protein
LAHLEEQNCGQTSSKLAEGEKLVCHPCDNAGHATHAVRTLSRTRIFYLLRSPRIDSKETAPPGFVVWWAGRQPYSVPSPHRLFTNFSTFSLWTVKKWYRAGCICINLLLIFEKLTISLSVHFHTQNLYSYTPTPFLPPPSLPRSFNSGHTEPYTDNLGMSRLRLVLILYVVATQRDILRNRDPARQPAQLAGRTGQMH